MKEETRKARQAQILTLALDIGEYMLKCGAEINRVENSILRICTAYNMTKINVFSITSLIIVSAHTEDGDVLNESRRIYSYGTDLYQLEEANALSRYVCEEKPAVEEIKERILTLEQSPKRIRLDIAAGYILSSSAFCVFFGGNLMDGLATLLVAIVVFFVDAFFKEHSMNQIFYTICCSFLCGILGILLVRIGIGQNIDKIMIGDIMLFVPGIGIINSLRDMLCGDTMSGILRLINSLLIAIAIAVGFALSLILLGGIR